MDSSSLDLLTQLDRNNAALLNRLYASDVWQHLAAADDTTELVPAIIRNLLRQIIAYGPHVMQAISTSIGRLAMHPEFLTAAAPLSRFLMEEITHPNMAMDSYLQLGGHAAEVNHLAPAAAANLAAVFRFTSEQRHPLAILGPLYLFECTTAEIAPQVEAFLLRRALKVRFIEVHAKEDIAHASHLQEMIARVASGRPDVAREIASAHECFSLVYPEPVWSTALDLAVVKGL